MGAVSQRRFRQNVDMTLWDPSARPIGESLQITWYLRDGVGRRFWGHEANEATWSTTVTGGRAVTLRKKDVGGVSPELLRRTHPCSPLKWQVNSE